MISTEPLVSVVPALTEYVQEVSLEEILADELKPAQALERVERFGTELLVYKFNIAANRPESEEDNVVKFAVYVATSLFAY